ncbi:MAG: hypothetical protein V1870_05550 [Candidatus Aenigmatarchaeota archaeon]
MKPNPKKVAECFGSYVRDVSKACLAQDQDMLDYANAERDKHPFEFESRIVPRRDSFHSPLIKAEVYPICSQDVSVFQNSHEYSFLMDECALRVESYLLLTATNTLNQKSAICALTRHTLMGTTEEIISCIDAYKLTQPKQIIIRDMQQKILYETAIDDNFLWELYHSKKHVVKKQGKGFVVEHV